MAFLRVKPLFVKHKELEFQKTLGSGSDQPMLTRVEHGLDWLLIRDCQRDTVEIHVCVNENIIGTRSWIRKDYCLGISNRI